MALNKASAPNDPLCAVIDYGSSLIGFHESRDGFAELRLLCLPVRAEQPEMMWVGGLQPCAGYL